VRRGTTIVLVALLALILGSALVQFLILGR